MYETTQADFKTKGIKEITLYRGVSGNPFSGTNVKSGDAVKLNQNTLESWTSEPEIAKQFGNTILKATVPVERILSTARTGFGCLNEFEFVVIGGGKHDSDMVTVL